MSHAVNSSGRGGGGAFEVCTGINMAGRQQLPAAPVPQMIVSAQDLFVKSGSGEVFTSFRQWLSDTLSKEQELFAWQVKDVVAQQLQEYRQACLNEVRTCTQPALNAALVRPVAPFGSESLPEPEPKAVDVGGVQLVTRQEANGLSDSVPGAVGHSDGGKRECKPTAERVEKNKTAQSLHKKSKEHEFEVDHELHAGLVFVQHMVRSPKFEVASLGVIVMNTIMLAYEIQYTGFDTGFHIKFPDFDERAEDIWPNAPAIFLVCSVLFCSFFVVELVLRLVAMRSIALRSYWIWCDLVLVPLGVYDALCKLDLAASLGFNATALRVIRLLRLMRLARTMKGRDAFHSLFLLVKSVQASTTALAWSILILFLIMCSFSLAVDQIFRSYFKDDKNEIRERHEVFGYFGTFTRTLITMFEVTFGNWVPPTRLVMATLGQGWAGVFVVYRCVLCFAILNVIRAVFITETNRVASNDDEVALMIREAYSKEINRKLDTLFMALDHSGDGNIDWEDFEQGLHDPIILNYMNLLDIDCTDLYNLFKLLDNGDGQVDWKEFSTNVKSLRGHARSLELITTLANVQKLNGQMDTLERAVRDFIRLDQAIVNRGRSGGGSRKDT